MATPTTLPASFTDGTALPASSLNALRGAFRILQVVQGSTATALTMSSTTFVDTGLTATITPQSSSSKILVIVHQNGGDKGGGNAGNAINLDLYRGAILINSITGSTGYTGTAFNVRVATISTMYLDSPGTTSATTYKTMLANDVAAASVSVQLIGTSTITLMEVSA